LHLVQWDNFWATWYAQQEIGNKMIITYPATPHRCRYTTLWYISFQKLQRPKAQQRQTRRARTEENVTEADEVALGQYDQPKIHCSTRTAVWCRVGHFFTTILVWSVCAEILFIKLPARTTKTEQNLQTQDTWTKTTQYQWVSEWVSE